MSDILALQKRVSDLEKVQSPNKVNVNSFLSWRAADAHWCIELQGIRVEKKKLITRFTVQGLLAVIANQLIIVAETMIKARNELADEGTKFACPSTFVLNGLMSSALIGMQGVQDAIATFCQKQAPDDAINGLFDFSTYAFVVTKFEFIKLHRNKLNANKFNGRSTNELANCCKHELPWLGMVSTNVDGINDITDETGVQLLRNVMIPAYMETTKIIARIGGMYNCPVKFPLI
jgi:hypothetical protein